MTLIDTARAVELYDRMPPGLEASGGSAANTMAGIASLGSTAAYIGKVRDDQLGDLFRHDIRAQGVSYEVPLAAEGPAHGPVPDPCHPRRRTDDEHLPGDLVAARAGRHRHRPRPRQRRGLLRGLPLGCRLRQGRDASGHGHGEVGRQEGGDVAFGRVLRRPSSCRVSGSRRELHRSAVRQRT